ncbi:MAG: TetR/AcrR family transcriptional regulator, partial [candidate division NC10 bacterium]
MALVSERSAASRRRLLEAAAAELIARGGTAEVAAVAARSGASVGLIYRHFGSKAGLIAAVVEDFYHRLDGSVLNADLAPGADWPTRERLRTRRNVAFHYAEPLAPVILGYLAREPEVAAVEARRIASHIEAAARNIRRAQKNGEIPPDLDPELAAAMVLGGIRQALGAALARPVPPPQDIVADELWRFVVAAVG